MLKHICVFFAATSLAAAAATPKKGEVTLQVASEGEQPAGWPLVLELKMTNTGVEPISWWTGGPGNYPGAQHFTVQVRYNYDNVWHDVEATNGQYTVGSGIGRSLKTGGSVAVPLAIPLKKTATYVSVRIGTRDWKTAETVETSASLSEARRVINPFRAKMIATAIRPTNAFQLHLVERYADPVVLDALRKLATVENETIMTSAAAILAQHKAIPNDTAEVPAVEPAFGHRESPLLASLVGAVSGVMVGYFGQRLFGRTRRTKVDDTSVAKT